jgi:hypothetical protein
MKKLIILLLFLNHFCLAQNIKVGNLAFSNEKVDILTFNNVPGLLHTGNFPNAPSMGTIYKTDGPYLQTFTNHPLNFAVANSSVAALQINTQSNVRIANYTQINSISSGVLIKQIKYIGFTDNFDGSNPATNDGTPNETRIAHGLDASKIMAISLICNVSTGFDVCEEFQYYTGYQLSISYDNTYIHVWNYPNNSNLIRNKPFKFLITFKK